MNTQLAQHSEQSLSNQRAARVGDGTRALTDIVFSAVGERFERVFNGLEMLSDAAAVLMSTWISYSLYQSLDIGKHVVYPPGAVSAFAAGFSVLLILLLDRAGAYRLGNSLLRIKETERVIKSSVIAFAIVLPMGFVTKEAFPRLLVGIGFLVVQLTVITEKQLLYIILRKFHERGFGVRRVVIYGAGFTGRRVFSAITHSPKLGLLPVAFVDDDKRNAGKQIFESSYTRNRSIPIISEPISKELLCSLKAETLVIAVPSIERCKMSDILAIAADANVSVAFVPGDLVTAEKEVDSVDIDGILLARLSPGNSRLLYGVFKRFFDIIVAGGLLVSCAPILLLIGVLVKLDSKGPALFRQKRVGARGGTFTMYKFRTMRTALCGDSYSPISSEDLRITRVGRLLRRLSLDELPQLLNVLRGDMSLVGPRPEMPFIVAQYNSRERQRLSVKPGITGLWQLSADRRFLIHENLQYDLYYIKNRGFFLDLAILLHTVVFALRGI